MWHPDGKVTIWRSSQEHFAVRDQTAMVLGIPVSRVKVNPMEIGGDFGGKTLIYLEPVAALLSKKTGHPVKLMMSRAEVFEGTGPTSGAYMRVKMGATKDGRLPAAAFAAETGVVQAIWGLVKPAMKTRFLMGLGVAALVLSLIGMDEVLLLFGAGVLAGLVH